MMSATCKVSMRSMTVHWKNNIYSLTIAVGADRRRGGRKQIYQVSWCLLACESACEEVAKLTAIY